MEYWEIPTTPILQYSTTPSLIMRPAPLHPVHGTRSRDCPGPVDGGGRAGGSRAPARAALSRGARHGRAGPRVHSGAAARGAAAGAGLPAAAPAAALRGGGAGLMGRV